MPSLTINTSKLKKIVNLANQISLKKDPNLQFTSTRAKIENNQLLLSATDNKIHFKTFVDAENLNFTNDSDALYIPTSSFSSILNLIDDENVLIEVDNTIATLKGSKTKNKLNLENIFDDYKFPQPKFGDDDLYIKFKINIEDFILACKSVFVSVGNPKSTYQPEFLNILFDVKMEEKKVVIVSSDRFRIAKNVVDIDIIQSNQENMDFSHFFQFFPKPLQFVVSSLAEAKDTELTITMYRYFAYFDFDDYNISLSFGNDNKFPAEYNKIIAESFACSFEVNKQDFLIASRQVSWCITDNVNKPVNIKLNPTEKTLTLITQNAGGDASEYSIFIENYEGGSEIWEQSFNLGYLENYLNTIKTDKFLWEVNYKAPSVLSPFDLKKKQLYLVSGLR